MRILSIFGTRPEGIKMAPLVQMLAAQEDFESRVCVTGQHREMLDQVLDVFGIVPDHDLSIMRPNQTLTTITTAVLEGLQGVIADEKPDYVLVHGDTTTSMAAAMAAFYARVPVGHVEAGLRTGNMDSPWPEEMNRCVVDRISSLLFAPTASSRQNLLSESIDNSRIAVTGNTVIDALHIASQKVKEPALRASFEKKFAGFDSSRRLILVTAHRRESFGEGIVNIASALKRLAQRDDVEIVYPVHPNPNIKRPVEEALSGLRNVHLIEPLDYLPFVYLMDRAHMILTDSGGVQEEAPALGKPVLVMRDTTERPEAVAAGTVAIVGTSAQAIYANTTRILDDAALYGRFARAQNPYGDGKACARIVAALRQGAIAPEAQFMPATSFKVAAE